MKWLIPLALSLFLLTAGPLPAKSFTEDNLEMSDLSKKYLFYLHGAIVEGEELNPTHPVFGYYDMVNIRSVLADQDNLLLISDHRPKDTSITDYANKLANDVKSLIEDGVPAQNITISGFSKGGMIAIRASSILQNDQLNFIFMAACNSWAFDNEEIRVAGRILSIYETTDTIGHSCQPLIGKSPAALEYKEVAINTGKKHGAFYQPIPEWVKPFKAWLD